MEKLTFNDIPEALAMILEKLDTLERAISTMALDSGKEYLSTTEAAEFIDKTPNALRLMVFNGQIASHKRENGKKLYFRKQDLIEWMASGKRMSEKEREEYAKMIVEQN